MIKLGTQIEKIGAREHPEHAEKADLWDFLLSSYRGGLGNQGRTGMTVAEAERLKPSGYYYGLFKFKREATEDYLRRVMMTPYRPYARRIVETFAKYVTREEPEREGATGFDDLIADADLRGDDLRAVVAHLLGMWRTLGTMNVLVDMPNTEGRPPISRLDALNRRIRPYVVPVLPQNVVDWQLDEYGRYEWVIIQTTYSKSADLEKGGKEAESKMLRRRTYWDAAIWQVYEETKKDHWELADEGDHPCGECPLIRIEDTDIDNDAVTPECWFFDLADINRAIYNMDSLDLSNFYLQTLGILILPAGGSLGEGNEAQALSATEAFTEAPGENGISRFISPTGENHAAFETKIMNLRMEMYRLSGLHHRTESKAAETAEAKAYDREDMNQFLSSTARGADRIEQEIFRLAAAWQGRSADGVTVAYPRDYSVPDVEGLFRAALDLKAVGFGSEIGRKEMLKKLYWTILPDLSPEILVRIEAEIDASEPAADPFAGFDMTDKGGQDNMQEQNQEEMMPTG